MSTLDPDVLLPYFAPVARVLNRELGRAVTDVESVMTSERLDLPQHRYLTPRAHLVRARTHRLLDRAADLEDWQLTAAAGPNTPLHLTRMGVDGVSVAVRVLHTHQSTFVPPPGRNRSRRAYYTNTPLPGNFGIEPLFEDHQFLVLWNANYSSGDVECTLVHTVGAWSWGRSAKVDLLVPLLDDADEFANLRFEERDEEEADEVYLPDEQQDADEEGETGAGIGVSA